MADVPQLQPTNRGNGRRKKPLPSHIGRHTKLNPDVQKKIVDAVRAGAYLSVAAQYAGVSQATLMNWMDRGRNCPSRKHKDSIYLDFLEEVTQAQAATELAANIQWRAAWAKDWHSAKDWLVGRFPERYDTKRDQLGTSQAFAGVNINIGGSTGPNGANNAPEVANTTLEALIERDPRLLGVISQLFDVTDAIYDQTASDDAESAQMTPNSALTRLTTPIAPAYDPFEVIEGDFSPIDPESDQ